MHFHHLQLAMPAGGEFRARVFYRDALGFDEIERPAALGGSGPWFRSGDVEIHLGIDDDFRPARKAHPGIEVDDLDALAARLIDHGYEVRWDHRYPGWRRFSTDDPFGNRLGFLSAAGL